MASAQMLSGSICPGAVDINDLNQGVRIMQRIEAGSTVKRVKKVSELHLFGASSDRRIG
jgi:hypothetical protein